VLEFSFLEYFHGPLPDYGDDVEGILLNEYKSLIQKILAQPRNKETWKRAKIELAEEIALSTHQSTLRRLLEGDLKLSEELKPFCQQAEDRIKALEHEDYCRLQREAQQEEWVAGDKDRKIAEAQGARRQDELDRLQDEKCGRRYRPKPRAIELGKLPSLGIA